MPVIKFIRKVHQEIEGIQYNGTNIEEIDEWMGKTHRVVQNPNFKVLGLIYVMCVVGELPLYPGDYVVKSAGGFYVFKPDVLKDIYEEA